MYYIVCLRSNHDQVYGPTLTEGECKEWISIQHDPSMFYLEEAAGLDGISYAEMGFMYDNE